MGNLIMILGKSGSGKSTSLRNFKPDEVGVFSVAGKRLPFRSELPIVQHAQYARIAEILAANKRRCYVIDDATYLMQFDNFARAKETGFAKYVDMAVSFQQLLQRASWTSEDTNVYFLMHPDVSDMGVEKPKTIGKLLDEKLCVEGLFPIVIDARVVQGEDGRPRHVFVTENDGTNLAKAPMGMLPPTMDNDLREVDTLIREYWQMKPLTDKAAEAAEKE